MFYKWTGAVNHAWTESGNWVNENGVAYTTGYPGAGDHVVINDLPDTTNPIDGADVSAGRLASLRIGSGYNLAIGSSTTYLKLDFDKATIEATEATGIYIECAETCGPINVIGGNTSGIFLAGAFHSPQFHKGVINIQDDAVISLSMYIGYLASQSTDVVMTIGQNVTLPTTVVQSGGSVYSESAVNTLQRTGGMWTQYEGNVGTITNQGGDFNWAGGNITNLANIIAGKFTKIAASTPRYCEQLRTYPAATVDCSAIDETLIKAHDNWGGSVTMQKGQVTNPYSTRVATGDDNDVYGIAPKTLANTDGDYTDGVGVQLADTDRIDIIISVGAVAGANPQPAVIVAQASDDTFADESAVSTALLVTADSNKTYHTTIYGYQLATGNSYVRVKLGVQGEGTAVMSATYIKSSI
jgi:hypothetical protein